MHGLGVGEHPPGQGQERLACHRERAAAAGAGEQFGAEVLLERADLAAQRRLGQVQMLGGAGEVSQARYRDKPA